MRNKVANWSKRDFFRSILTFTFHLALSSRGLNPPNVMDETHTIFLLTNFYNPPEEAATFHGLLSSSTSTFDATAGIFRRPAGVLCTEDEEATGSLMTHELKSERSVGKGILHRGWRPSGNQQVTACEIYPPPQTNVPNTPWDCHRCLH